MERRVLPFDFSRKVPSGTPEEEPVVRREPMPYDGRVSRLLIGWPKEAVGVQVRSGEGEIVFPRPGQNAQRGEFVYAPGLIQQEVKADLTLGQGEALGVAFTNTGSSSGLCQVLVEYEVDPR